VHDEGVRLATIDTRRGDLFAQVFAGPDRPVTDAVAIAPPALAALVSSARLGVIGDGAATAAECLRAAGRVVTVHDVRHPAPLAVAMLAARRWAAGERPAGMPEPFYLHSPAVGPLAAPRP
jgi:tRNA A37 threonylcarbamoyladenosine modification protein TsaB